MISSREPTSHGPWAVFHNVIRHWPKGGGWMDHIPFMHTMCFLCHWNISNTSHVTCWQILFCFTWSIHAPTPQNRPFPDSFVSLFVICGPFHNSLFAINQCTRALKTAILWWAIPWCVYFIAMHPPPKNGHSLNLGPYFVAFEIGVVAIWWESHTTGLVGTIGGLSVLTRCNGGCTASCMTSIRGAVWEDGRWLVAIWEMLAWGTYILMVVWETSIVWCQILVCPLYFICKVMSVRPCRWCLRVVGKPQVQTGVCVVFSHVYEGRYSCHRYCFIHVVKT